MNWFVLYTKPQYEIKTANALNSLGFEAYCPTYTQIKQYSDRKKKVVRPLLPSYIFIKIEEKHRDKVFCISGTVRYLFWLGKPAIVQENEILLMKNNLAGIYDKVSIKKLKIGSQYDITHGHFKGQSGKIIEMSKNHVKLELASIGISLSLRAA